MTTYIGSSSGVTSATLPAHQVGDLIIGFAFRDGSTTAPTLPSGWTSIHSATGANTCGARLAYKYAASSSETSGTWTNATSVIFRVYRGVHAALAIGRYLRTTGASTTVTYGALTNLIQPDGTSWIAAFAGHRSVDTSLETPPSGMTLRTTVVDATDEAAGHDTNGGVTTWPSTNVSVGGTSSGWISYVLEIVNAPTGNSGVSVNHTLYGTDYFERTASVPNVAAGILVVTRTKVMAPPPYSYTNAVMANCYPFSIKGSNYRLQCINGNMAATSASAATWNCNTSLANSTDAWVGDFSSFTLTGQNEAPLLDWVYSAWLIIMPTDGSACTFDQKIRRQGDASYQRNTDNPTVATLGFTPGAPSFFNVGADAGGGSASVAHFSMYGMRIYERNTMPTDAELDAIFASDSADTTAWADYQLNWSSGAPNLVDRSGNNRNLSVVSGGTIRQGMAAQVFSGGPIELLGAAYSQASASASLTSGISLAAAAISGAGASAGLTSHISLAGAAVTLSSASGQLTAHVTLAGAALAQALAASGLDTTIRLAGGGSAQAGAGGDLTTGGGAAHLEAAANVQAGAAAILTTQITLQGSAAALAGVSGNLTSNIPLSATAIVQALATGSLSLEADLTGAASAQAGASGALTTGITLQGAAITVPSASGTITSDISLGGAAIVLTDASGQLTAQIRFTGSALATALAAAGLDTSILLAGAGLAQAAASGDLYTPGSASDLAASASAAASATAELTVQIRLAGGAAAVVGSSGVLTSHITLSASALAQAIATGSLNIGILMVRLHMVVSDQSRYSIDAYDLPRYQIQSNSEAA